MHDLVTLGEVLLRLAVPSPARFETVRQLDLQIGGAEANVAAACARLGLRVAWISGLPDNAWGDRIRRDLTGHGVDCGHVHTVSGARVGVYFLEYGVAPRPIRVLYDRRESAFARLVPEAVDWDPIRRARLVHVTGVTAGLGGHPRALVRRALAEAQAVSFDVNYRAALWSPAEAQAFLEEILPAVAYLFVGREEARTIWGLDGPAEAMLETLARLAPRAVIVVMEGADGSAALVSGRVLRPARRVPVQVVDPIGAGDAYVAGFLWATLSGRDPQAAVDAGNAVASLKCTTWGDIALVDRRDLDDLLAGGSDVRR